MIDIRTAGLAGALVLAAGAGLWSFAQHQLLTAAAESKQQLKDQVETAQGEASQNLATATELKQTLNRERETQAQQLQLLGELRLGLADRRRQIEDLTRENEELRAWAGQPLPDTARRLRERPTIIGADAYRDWLSRSRAVRPAGDGAGQQRNPAQ